MTCLGVLFTIPDQDGGARLQIKLVELLLEDCISTVTEVNCIGFKCLI